MNMRADSPGWKLGFNWEGFRHFYHNIDGSNTDRSQEGIGSNRAGSKAEFTFSGMCSECACQAVNPMNLRLANTQRFERRKCNLPHRQFHR